MVRTPASDAQLRLILVTDGFGDPRRIEAIVASALRGGLRCLQLREPKWTARQMLRSCETLLPMLAAADGLLLVNDRIDVCAAGAAHGAQIGHRSLPPQHARRVLGPDAVLGYSAHNEQELVAAERNDCDFALVSPVWPTSSKPDAAFLTVARAVQLTATVQMPVLWLGGVDLHTMAELGAVPKHQRPVGVAVRSAIMLAEDPEQYTRALLSAWPQD